MAPSFEYSVSSLLCAEESAILCEENEEEQHPNHDLKNRSFVDDVASSLAVQSDDVFGSMVESESHHLPALDYLNRLKTGDLDLFSRNQAVDWILKANAHFGFGPLCTFLSINYMDRFLSAYELPKGKCWTMQLLGVACLSLAAKMEETDVPLSLDLQVGDIKFVFEARTIQRMELLVLSTLKWRMKALTPFNFIDLFLHKLINHDTEDDDDVDDNDNNINNNNRIKTPLKSSILRSTQLILGILKGIDFLEFKPSEIACAVAICVASETKAVDTLNPIPIPIPLFIQQHLQKERLVKCIELVNGTTTTTTTTLINNGTHSVGWGWVQSEPQSPIGVLEATSCLSYKTHQIQIPKSSSSSSSSSSSTSSTPSNKRRKLNTPFQEEL